MATGKKFGTFGGVFTPSILTILGVIMYLRMGWVVGNAGIYGTIFIILVAHIISVSTGLSISSIATDKKVGAGGVYYVLSRSLGLPIGGALGLTLFVATALSISLYMVGFAEIFNEYIGFGYELNENNELIKSENFTNTIRITGSIGLLVLTIIAFISTSIAIKTQFIILAIIILSLFSIFLGNGMNAVPLAEGVSLAEPVGYAAVFAIFFPAVTGFTAGVAMSGDLKDPKKSIPSGTMGSIAVGFVIYMALAIFLYFAIEPEVLRENPKALFQMAAIGILVYAGVWGATLSSALGGILGGPRILQAMSVDKITPKLFAKGVGRDNEPRNALILTVIIAEAGVLIGDLNVIAEVVSMFYLAAYGFINLSFFLESWASSDFNPTFRVKKWVGLLGFIATFTVMSQLNLLAMVAAFIIIGGIYFYLSRKQVALGTGDIWQSVWSTVVKKGLKRMESGNDHKRNWKPNTLLFSTDNEYRTKMIEFSKAVSGQAGIITNFDLHENPDAKVLFPKSKETVKDEELEKYGIFGRKLEVQNIFKGIESIACTFGFSGIEPNTVLMNWPGQTKDPVWFKEMTEKLIELDYNVLYLDYDDRWGFRKKEQIDLWWRGVGNNAELMLSLAKFITGSPEWSQANIRILLVNDTNVDFKVIENRIQFVVDQFRVNAEIKVVNNEVDQKPIYDLMKIHSSEADLVFVGIPEIEEGERKEFVERTNNLVSVIGTTLLVKASSQFDETDLKLEQISLKHEPRKLEYTALAELEEIQDENFSQAIADFDQKLDTLVEDLIKNGVQPIENYHHTIFSKVIDRIGSYLPEEGNEFSIEEVHSSLMAVLNEVGEIYADALKNQLPIVYDSFENQVGDYLDKREMLIANLPKKVRLQIAKTPDGINLNANRQIQFRNSIQRIWYAKGIQDEFQSLLEFGYQNLILLHQSKNSLHEIIWKLLESINEDGISGEALKASKEKLDEALHQVDEEALNLAANLFKELRNNERLALNEFIQIVPDKRYIRLLQEKYPGLEPKVFKTVKSGTRSFPSYWYRNLILFTYHLKADLFLIGYTVGVQELIMNIKNYIRDNYLGKIEGNITDLQNQLNELSLLIENQNQTDILGTTVRIGEELFFNSEYLTNELMSKTAKIAESIPEEIELMTARSVNSIREAQGSEIATEKVALKDIAEYLARAGFIDPLHEKVQVFYEQLKRTTGKLVNSTVQVQKGIDQFSISGKYPGLKDTVSQAQADIEQAIQDLEVAVDSFNTELRDRQDVLRKDLDINQIVEQVETLRQYVKKHKRRNAVLDRFQQVNKSAGKRLGSFVDYVARKQNDISAIEYKQRYAEIVSEQGMLSEFTDSLRPKAELPFYYQQLFTGTHYSDSRTIENRNTEINKVQAAINRINEGRSGAIMILGSSGSGKTYLTTHVSNHLLTGKVYKVLPPVSRNWTKDDLTNGIQRATGLNENTNRVMNKVENGSVFIFENIEQWWLKASNGQLILNEVSRLINKFGSKHYFILTANIHSYGWIEKTTGLQDAVIQTVILPPLNAAQIKEVIWNRHQTGGLRISLDGENEQRISVPRLNKYLSRFHTTSKGVIGLALHQWIGAVKERKEGTLIMGNPTTFEVPDIDKKEWQNVIYQLFIHYNLSREELYRIYGDDNKNWINRVLQSLKTAAFIVQNERGEFMLKKEVKPYVENWLSELGFIK